MFSKLAVLLGLIMIVGLATVRVQYHPLNWGGYWSVELVAPWDRWQ